MDKIEVGKTYKINHSRKGSFVAKIIGTDGEWVTVEIVSGVAMALSEYNIAGVGERITIRISLIISAEEVK